MQTIDAQAALAALCDGCANLRQKAVAARRPLGKSERHALADPEERARPKSHRDGEGQSAIVSMAPDDVECQEGKAQR
jgi:hypothetical protein